MRRWFLILMLVLLPLRGWAADVMQVQRGSSGMAPHAATAMPAGCPMLASGADAKGSAAATAADPGCACDLCLPMLEAAWPPLAVPGAAAHVQPPAPADEFASTPPAVALKPPTA